MDHHEHKVTRTLREHKSLAFPLSLKQLDSGGVFAGYGSVFHVVDSQKDIVLPGAFVETIRDQGKAVKLLWQHDMREPIGVIEELREDRQGLYVRGRLLFEVARAREAYALLKEKVVTGLSIGYSPVRYRRDEATGTRHLSRIDLWEISLVTFPANRSAQVTVVKNHSDGLGALGSEIDRAIRSIRPEPPARG